MKRLVFILALLGLVLVASADRRQQNSRRASTSTNSSLLVSLIASWPLNEATGNATDESGAGLTLTDQGGVDSNTGKIYANARRYNFAGGSQYHWRASEAALQMGDIDFTITAWIYVENIGASYELVTKDDEAANSRDYTLDIGVSDEFRFYVNGNLTASWGAANSADTWYFVACGHDKDDDNVWISRNDGTVVTASTGGVAPQVSAAQFRVGAREYAGAEGYFDGRIQQVRIWKRHLSAAEITQLYNSGNGTTTPY